MEMGAITSFAGAGGQVVARGRVAVFEARKTDEHVSARGRGRAVCRARVTVAGRIDGLGDGPALQRAVGVLLPQRSLVTRVSSAQRHGSCARACSGGAEKKGGGTLRSLPHRATSRFMWTGAQ